MFVPPESIQSDFDRPHDGPIILCDPKDLHDLLALAPIEIKVTASWLYGPHETLYFGDPSGEFGIVKAAPTLCLALVSFTAEGAKRLDAVANKLLELGSLQAHTPKLLSAETDGLRLLLCSRLISMLREQATFATRLWRELASLRISFEQSQNAFSSLEAYVSGLRLQSPRLVFENLQDDRSEVGGFDVVEIKQILPVASLGLSSFQLKLTEKRNGDAIVSLRTLEDDVVHGSWNISEARIDAGWMTFPLSRAISGAELTAEVRISSIARTGIPYLALGRPQPLGDYRAITIGGGRAPAGSLAMRLWVGLPGVRPPYSTETADNSDVFRIRESPLSLAILKRVRRITLDWIPPFSVVEPLLDELAIQCHPPEANSVTVAVLDGFVPDRIGRFSATGQLESPDSDPVKFGIAYSSLPEDQVIGRIRRSDIGNAESEYVFSGWRTVAYKFPTYLSLQILNRNGHIYLATTMSDAASNRDARFTFRHITFTELSQRSAALALGNELGVAAKHLKTTTSKDHKLVDFGNMKDVTPTAWREWFTVYKYQTPTSVGRYVDIFPGLLVGYDDIKRSAVNITQIVKLGKAASPMYSLEMRITETINWITVEFIIPTEFWTAHKLFYLFSTIYLDVAQRVKLLIYEVTTKGEEFRTMVDTRFYTSAEANELYAIQLGTRDDVATVKLYFDFETPSFSFMKMTDARLFVQASPTAIEQV